MSEPTHSFRLWLFRKEATFRLTERALVWIEGGVEQHLDFADIRQVRVYELPGATGIPRQGRCVLRARKDMRRGAVIVQSNHFAGVGDIEDRSETYRPFAAELVKRIAAANPKAIFIHGMPMGLWLTWYVLLGLVVIVTPLAVAWMIYAEFHDKDLSPNFYVQLSVCVAALLALFPTLRILRRNKPRVFDPLKERTEDGKETA